MGRKRSLHIIWCLMQMIFLCLAIITASDGEYNASLVVIMVSVVGNIWINYINREQQIIILLFNMTMFLFLLGRPFVSFIRGESWWNVASSDAMVISLISIELVLVLLPVGALLIKKINVEKRVTNIESNMNNIEKVRHAALIILAFGLFASFADGIQKISYMSFHTYVDYYVDYTSNLPFLLKALVRMLKPSLCLYLATFPKKKSVFIVLSAYVLTTLPYIVIGMRSPTMLALLFSFTYYCMRDYLYSDGEKWVGKVEKMAIAIAVPVLIVFCYAYNYIRTGRDYSLDKDVFLNFFYQQGISFDYLAQGFDVLNSLPLKGWPGYMLGPSYDNIVYGSVIGRVLFGTSALGTQSMDAITIGHDMKQHLSYALIGDGYLLGYGTGAVFILEVIHDIGWIGLVIYSIALGWFCVKVMDNLASTKLLTSTIFIYATLQIYYVPRSDALYFLEQAVNPYFWITILFILILSKVKFR